ncbi:MAG: hypothetical protein ABW321_28080 [Polyangiales bacterium]
MKTITRDQLARAEQSQWLSARTLERLRFEQQFRGGPREPVLQALAAFQNIDGGFGHAIEPDFRGPVSQPLGSLFALGVLDELEALDAPIVPKLLRHLASITAADGGVPNVLANVSMYPRAPWWHAGPEPLPGSLLPTASIAGLLYRWRVDHAWLGPATEFCWRALERLRERAATASERIARIGVAYEARAAVRFLDDVPDRSRAERQAELLGQALDQAGLLLREPDPKAEATSPLDFAPEPRSVARRWIDDARLERHLDALVDSQNEDGGFDATWPIWTPVTGLEWRGILTVELLKTLRAYGRFDLA